MQAIFKKIISRSGAAMIYVLRMAYGAKSIAKKVHTRCALLSRYALIIHVISVKFL
jgi:hypothetical protein